MKKILIILGMFTLIFAASALTFAPPGPTNCLRTVGSGSVYQPYENPIEI